MNKLITIFKLLSDETRLRILCLLYQEELCVCQLSGLLEAPQSRVSKNLSKLRDLNLVTDERKDKFVYYSLKRNNIMLEKILGLLLADIDKYPPLSEDKRRLSDKDVYLKQCTSL